jgi:hypothetical protein
MSQYYYYSKNDKNKEKLGVINAHSQEEAVEKLATTKKIDINSLLSLWEIKKIENESKTGF